MNKLAILVALLLTGSTFTAHAQSNTASKPAVGGAGAGGGGFGHQGSGQHELPSPEAIAQQWMQRFDTNGDGELNQEELTKALEAASEHHMPRGAGQGGGRRGGRGSARMIRPGGFGNQGTLASQGNSTATGGQSSAAGTTGAANSSSTSALKPGSTTEVASAPDPQSESENGGRPPAGEIAKQLIERYAKDKVGLKMEELTQIIREQLERMAQNASASANTGAGAAPAQTSPK